MSEFETLLRTSYHFHSVSAKTSDFYSCISGENFWIRENLPISDSFIHSPAGGTFSSTASFQLRQDRIPYFLLLYVISGSGHCSCGTSSIQISEGMFLFFAPNTSWLFQSAETPFTFNLFFLQGDPLYSYAEMFFSSGRTFFSYSYPSSGSSLLLSRQSAILSMLSVSDRMTEFRLSSLFHLLLTQVLDDADTLDPHFPLSAHVAQMKSMFDTNYMDDLSLDILEQKLQISRYRLCRDFSKELQITPHQYLMQVRMKKARDLLSASKRTIHEVGSLVGISNTTHFINLFKKNTGTTPLQFRQNSMKVSSHYPLRPDVPQQ